MYPWGYMYPRLGTPALDTTTAFYFVTECPDVTVFV